VSSTKLRKTADATTVSDVSAARIISFVVNSARSVKFINFIL